MAHNVTGATLDPILDRLNGLPNYHPLDAETFSDWSLQAGDIVEMTRDGKTYQSPVHSTTMTWRGKAPIVTVNSSGKQKRDPVSKISRRKYGGGAGMRNNQGLYYEIHDEDGLLSTSIEAVAGRFELAITDERTRAEGQESLLRTAITVESGRITQEVSDRQSDVNTLEGKITVEKDRITQEVADRQADVTVLEGKITVEKDRITQEVTDRTSADSTLRGLITVESDRITQEVADRQGDVATLDGKITVEKDRITQEVTDRTNAVSTLSGSVETLSNKVSLVVTQKDGEDVVDVASIVAGINDQSGSYARIQARTINLDGYVKATDITTDFLNAKIGEISTLNGLSARFSGNMSVGGALMAGQVYVGSTAPYTNISNGIQYVRIAGPTSGQYTLEYKTFTGEWTEAGSFSKATSLSGNWSGNTYTVTATPQGNTESTTVQTRFGGNEGHFYFEAYRMNGSSPAVSIENTSKSYKLGFSGTTVQVQTEGGARYENTPVLPLSSYLQAKTISEDGSYTPDEGYIGFSSVEVTGTTGNVSLTGSWSGSTYVAVAKVNGSQVATAQTNISLIAQGGGTSSFTVAATTIGQGGGAGDVHVSKNIAMSLSGTKSSATVLAKFDGAEYGRLPVGSLYTAGVSAGEEKFSPVTVTVQGSQASNAYIVSSNLGVYHYPSASETKYDRGDAVSVTPINGVTRFSSVTRYTLGTSGTYYAAGTAKTYYNAGAVTKHDRGASVTVTPISAGVVLSQATRYTLGTSGTYYAAGTATTYYKAGTVTKTDRGTSVSVTPINGATRFSAVTRYTLGTAGTYYAAGTATTYYKAGTVTKNDRGGTVSVTPIGTATRFSAVTRYTLGTSGTYYAAGTAKTYYNAGTVTKNDRGASVTVYPAQNPSYFTTGTRYTAGTAATYYKGDGGTYTARGDSVSVTPIGTSKYFYTYNQNTKIKLYKLRNGSYVSAGDRYWFYATTSGGGTFYKAGTAATYYKGNGGTVVGRGTSVSVTPIGGGTTVYIPVPESQATVTFFKAGTATTYYKGDGGAFTVQGASVSVTPIGTSYTRYTLGTSGTYYQTVTTGGTAYYSAGTAVTYYKGDGGAFTVQGASVSVTPIGTSYTRYTLGTSETVYQKVSSGGTTYWGAGTPTTYYKGDGGAFTVQGASVSVTPIGTSYTRYTLGTSETVYVTASSGTTYHRAGTPTVYYKGDGGAFTVQGASVSVTPIGTSYTRYTLGTSETVYQKVSSGGTAYWGAGSTTTYYKGNGGAFTPIDAAGAKRLLPQVLYHGGASASYYEKNS